ncbi:MAG: cation diffusion facilitator family transporter [Syntrophomonadaceae bacterium]|jgi:cation diffusion facilitator family transporter
MNTLIKNWNYWLLKKTLKISEPLDVIEEPEKRKQVAFLEAWISIIGNLLLAAVKFLLGFLVNSISLISDAVHTASDVLTSLVVIIGFKLAMIPPDEKHPHGHGRIEFIASFVISLLLFAVGIQFAVSSYERYMANTAVAGTYMVAAIMVAAGLTKEIMARISVDLGSKISSSALVADAWHHRTDAIASLLVAVAIVASKFGYYRVDAILGMAVSLLIIFTGFEIFKESGSKLIGEVSQEEIIRVTSLASSVPGVVALHDICVHDYGATKAITLHIEIDENISREKAHEIAHQVQDTLNTKMYAFTTVHVDRIKYE